MDTEFMNNRLDAVAAESLSQARHTSPSHFYKKGTLSAAIRNGSMLIQRRKSNAFIVMSLDGKELDEFLKWLLSNY